MGWVQSFQVLTKNNTKHKFPTKNGRKSKKTKFENLNYLSSSNNLSPEYSKNTLDANKIDHEDEPNKRLFDGLTSTSSQTIFGSIEGDKIILWVKDVAKNLTTAYSFAALIDDLTYTSSDFFASGFGASPSATSGASGNGQAISAPRKKVP